MGGQFADYLPTDTPVEYAELGVWEFGTINRVIQHVAPGSTVHMFDFKDKFRGFRQSENVGVGAVPRC